LLAAQGRAPSTVLAAAAGVPIARWAGFASLLRQLLNVDSYEVLAFRGSEVGLDIRLLRDQFGLGERP
jgi:hypothetical protein